MFEKLYRIWKNGLIFEEINKILEKQIRFFGRTDQILEEMEYILE